MKEKNHLAQKTLFFSSYQGRRRLLMVKCSGVKREFTYGLELIFMLVDRR